MKKHQKLFAVLGFMLLGAAIPTWQIAHGETTGIIDIGNLTTTSVIVIVSMSAFGGLFRILIPFLRKWRDRERQRESDIEQNGKTSLQPLKFQPSFLVSWLIGFPVGIISTLLYASSFDLTGSILAIAITAFQWGLVNTWFVAEGNT